MDFGREGLAGGPPYYLIPQNPVSGGYYSFNIQIKPLTITRRKQNASDFFHDVCEERYNIFAKPYANVAGSALSAQAVTDYKHFRGNNSQICPLVPLNCISARPSRSFP